MMPFRACHVVSAILIALSFPATAAEVETMVVHPTMLLVNGARHLADGDISGARRYLATAARAGSAEGARMLAESYDPGWQASHGVSGVQWLADPDAAVWWYRRAVELGDTKPGNRYAEAAR